MANRATLNPKGNARRKKNYYSYETQNNAYKAGKRNFASQRQRANEQIKEAGRKTLALYQAEGREEEFWELRDKLRAEGVSANMKVYDKDGNLIPLMKFENAPAVTSKYSKTIAKEIVERIVSGETLKSICESEHLPQLVTIRKWYRDYPEFTRQIDQAYTERADYYVDQLYDLMNEVKTGELSPKQATFIADQIKWLAERLNPKFINKNRESPINVNVSDDGKVNFQILLHNPDVKGLLNGPETTSGGPE